jgi:hypothetical protein
MPCQSRTISAWKVAVALDGSWWVWGRDPGGGFGVGLGGAVAVVGVIVIVCVLEVVDEGGAVVPHAASAPHTASAMTRLGLSVVHAGIEFTAPHRHR